MLDSHFTPYHSSSKDNATSICSAHYTVNSLAFPTHWLIACERENAVEKAGSLTMVRSHCFGSMPIDSPTGISHSLSPLPPPNGGKERGKRVWPVVALAKAISTQLRWVARN